MDYVTLNQIDEAYRDCLKHKRNKKSAVEYSFNYLVNNYSLYRTLNNGLQNEPSLCFCVARPKLREIFAADLYKIKYRLITTLTNTDVYHDKFNYLKKYEKFCTGSG